MTLHMHTVISILAIPFDCDKMLPKHHGQIGEAIGLS